MSPLFGCVDVVCPLDGTDDAENNVQTRKSCKTCCNHQPGKYGKKAKVLFCTVIFTYFLLSPVCICILFVLLHPVVNFDWKCINLLNVTNESNHLWIDLWVMWCCACMCQAVEVTPTTGWVRCQQQAMAKQSWRSLSQDSSCFTWSKVTHRLHKYAGEEDHELLLSARRSVGRGSQRFSPGLHEVQSGRSGWGGDSGPSRSLGRLFLQRPDVLGSSSGRCSALRSVRGGTPDREHQILIV